MERGGPGKTRLGAAIFRLDARRRLRGVFSSGLARGLPALAAGLQRNPLIVAMNHVSFWDGFVLACLGAAASADAYCLMDRSNLERLSFLRFAGAVPVDCLDARRAREDLAQAAQVLDRPGRLLFVFPQGKQVPAQLPLCFRSGVLHLAELSGASVVPAGLRYEFLQDPKPEVRVSIGSALSLVGSQAERRRLLEHAVRAELDEIDATLARESAEAAGFEPFLAEARRGLPLGSRLLASWSAGRAT